MKASIIIRAYNAEATIGRALKTALAQSLPRNDFEIIVVDDGSRDQTADILARYQNEAGVRIITQKNAGAIAAGNRGLQESRGDYVTLLDADDEFDPQYLGKSVASLESSGADIAYCDYYEEFQGKRSYVAPASVFGTIAVGVLYRRSSFEHEGFYREGIFFAEYEIVLRTLGRWKSVYIPEPLFTYHRSVTSLTADTSRVERGLTQLREIHPDKANEIAHIRPYALS